MLDTYERTEMEGALGKPPSTCRFFLCGDVLPIKEKQFFVQFLFSEVPCSVFRGKQDRQLSNEELFQGWFKLFGQDAEKATKAIIIVEGNHGLVFDSANRAKFFNRIIDILDKILLGIDYGQ